MTTPAPRRVTPTGLLVLPASAPRDEWLAARQKLVGSSDVADILGVGYSTIAHVYYDKLGQLPGDDAGEEAHWGHLHEETVAREWARRNKTTIQKIGLVRHQDEPWMGCTLDRRVGECPLGRHPGLDNTRRGGCCLEVKTRSAFVAGKWKRGVPDDVHAQVLWQMLVTGYDHVHVAVLIGGNKMRQFTVWMDVELATRVRLRVGQFWAGNVQRRVPPAVADLGAAHPDRLTELQNRLHPNREGTTRFDDRTALQVVEALREYNAHGEAEAAAKLAKARVAAELVTLLRGGDTAVLDNERAYTYESQNRARKTDFDRLAEEWPDAYDACVTQPSGPSIRIYWKESA